MVLTYMLQFAVNISLNDQKYVLKRSDNKIPLSESLQ